MPVALPMPVAMVPRGHCPAFRCPNIGVLLSTSQAPPGWPLALASPASGRTMPATLKTTTCARCGDLAGRLFTGLFTGFSLPFLGLPLTFHWLLTAIPWPFLDLSLPLHCLFTASSRLLTACSLPLLKPFLDFSLPVHCLFTAGPLTFHWLLTALNRCGAAQSGGSPMEGESLSRVAALRSVAIPMATC